MPEVSILKAIERRLRYWISVMVRPLYRLRDSKPRNWESKNYTEKVRWRCHHPDPSVDYTTLVDKARVKPVVEPCFPVARTFDYIRGTHELDITTLPPTYVMKATHSWNKNLLIKDGTIQGGNRNNSYAGDSATRDRLQVITRKWLKKSGSVNYREWHYESVERGILFEEYLSPIDCELQFFLFHGVCHFCMALRRGFLHPQDWSYRLHNADGLLLDPGECKESEYYDRGFPSVPWPDDVFFEQLFNLCKDMDHVRADFFLANGQLYFSEFTFTHNAGYPSLVGRFDAELGRHWTR